MPLPRLAQVVRALLVPVAVALGSGALSMAPMMDAAAGVTDRVAKPAPGSLDEAADALRDGDAARAAALYDKLAQQSESLAAEVGLIRATLQAGEFRKAVAFGNLTSGEHPESAEAGALIAFLNDRVGRTEQALDALQRIEAAHPDEWVPIVVHAEILIDRLAPDQAIRLIQTWQAKQASSRVVLSDQLLARARAQDPAVPLRQNTWLTVAFRSMPLEGRRIIGGGNGVVIDGGRTLLTYAGVLPAAASEVIVRNGLGQIRRARVDAAAKRVADTSASPKAAAAIERGASTSRLVRLTLTEPYPSQWSVPLDQVGAPEGVRFCFALGFSTPRSPVAAYPVINPGLVFRADVGLGGLMQLTSALGPGHDGAPVFDARGRLIGLAFGNGEHQIEGQSVRTTLGTAHVALRVDEALTGATRAAPDLHKPAGPQPPMPAVEELYERLSPAVVQVIALQ